MSDIIIAALISSFTSLTGVFTASWLQTKRIDSQNKAALALQTREIAEHIESQP
jgi:hypothetical protein